MTESSPWIDELLHRCGITLPAPDCQILQALHIFVLKTKIDRGLLSVPPRPTDLGRGKRSDVIVVTSSEDSAAFRELDDILEHVIAAAVAKFHVVALSGDVIRELEDVLDSIGEDYHLAVDASGEFTGDFASIYERCPVEPTAPRWVVWELAAFESLRNKTRQKIGDE